MKLTLALLCSLLLAGTLFLPAPAPAACVGRTAHVACPCGMPCCRAPAAPKPPAMPAAPAPASNQTQLLTVGPAALVWILPTAPRVEISTAFPSPLMANRTPLFARNCTFLI
jgi:hypothetical protein